MTHYAVRVDILVAVRTHCLRSERFASTGENLYTETAEIIGGANRMSANDPDTSPSETVVEPIVDHETLRGRDDVAYHDETDVVDAETVEWMADAADLAAVGVTNDDGELLLRRQTDTCSWKVPVATVGTDEDFAAAISTHVRESIGFDLELDAVEGVWDISVRTEDGEQTASRAFVTFSARPISGGYDLDAVTPTGDAVEEAGWFETLPEDASEIPGTGLFVD